MFDDFTKLDSHSTSSRVTDDLTKLGQRVDSLLDIVQKEVASWTEGKRLWENRKEHRQPYNGRIVFVSVDQKTELPVGEPYLAECRDISPSGLQFSHQRPISSRKIALKLIDEPEETPFVIVSLRWTRFTKEHVYHSGAKVICNARFQLEETLDYNLLEQW